MSNTKKGLLNENTIRRFMKLAEIDTLSDGFVDGLVQETKVTVKEQETVEEQEDFDTGEEESGVTGPDVDDLDMADVEGPEGGDEASDLTAAVANLMDVISSMTGVDIDVDGGEEEEVELGGEEEEVELDVEDEIVMQEEEEDKEKQPAAAGIGDAIQGAEKAGRQTTAAMGESVEAYRHALKQEVLRRVHGRIQQERHNDAVADQLSERILQRIKNRR